MYQRMGDRMEPVRPGTVQDPSAVPASFPPKTVGRLAGAFFTGTGLVVLAALPSPAMGTVSRPAILGLALAVLLVGAFALLAPWDRWPARATLALGPVGLGLVAFGTYVALDGESPEVALLYLVAVCAWVGVSHPRWTTLWLSPVAALAWVVPVMVKTGDGIHAGQVAFALPVCVLIGELLAWIVGRLRATEGSLRATTAAFEHAYEKERRSAERLRELDEMKTAILSAVSHDLRTPITSVLGYARTLQRLGHGVPEEQAREFLDAIVANARRLDRLVSDLLDLDRLTRGVLAPNRRPTDLRALAESVVGTLDLGGHTVEVESAGGRVLVDPARTERILENLVANAAKYTPEGTPIWIRVRPEDGGVLIAVEDAGPGIPDEDKLTIFEPFRRGESLRPCVRGTGVGLSLVAHFAQLHGGRAWVEDREGGGASFRVYLPAPGAAEGDREGKRAHATAG